MDELAPLGVARVRDQVGFGEARSTDIPGIGFDRDVVFEQGAGFGAPVEAFLSWCFLGFKRRSMVAGLIIVNSGLKFPKISG